MDDPEKELKLYKMALAKYNAMTRWKHSMHYMNTENKKLLDDALHNVNECYSRLLIHEKKLVPAPPKSHSVNDTIDITKNTEKRVCSFIIVNIFVFYCCIRQLGSLECT